MEEEKKNESIGALWQNQSKSGDNYFTGNITIEGKETKIVIFHNQYKKEGKQPDFKIFISKPKEITDKYTNNYDDRNAVISSDERTSILNNKGQT